MTGQVEIRAKNDLNEIERVSQFATEFGERVGLPDRIIFAMNLALEEILVNIINYGYEDGDVHDVCVRLVINAQGALVIEVEDDARPFDPTRAPDVDLEQSLEDRNIGGLGIHLVRTLFDDFEYHRREPRGNLLILKKRDPGLSQSSE